MNGQGNLGGPGFGGGAQGIGGSRSWWWDEGLASMMVSLLEPAGRAPTLHAWLAHDAPPAVYGHGVGNGYSLDCEPIGSTSCTYSSADQGGVPLPLSSALSGKESWGPFYCYNPSAFFSAMGSHLRLNNDSSFLRSTAAGSSLTVDQVLEFIATDYEEFLLPGR